VPAKSTIIHLTSSASLEKNSRPPLRRPTQNLVSSRHQLRALSHPRPETYPGPRATRSQMLSSPSMSSPPPPALELPKHVSAPSTYPGHRATCARAYGAICCHMFKPQNIARPRVRMNHHVKRNGIPIRPTAKEYISRSMPDESVFGMHDSHPRGY
jgi:hypothetical protein